jgi:ADP-ribosyl-[dinitrogen reductase] hydrolase
VLKNSIAFTGDVDTVATIAMAAASVSSRICANEDLPPWLVDGLENGQYGRDYLIDLDKQLDAKYGLQGR